MFITGNISTEELADKTGTYTSSPTMKAILNRVSCITRKASSWQ